MSSAEINWKLTPTEFLNEIGWQSKKRGNWLSVVICPFCRGGDHGDRATFVVHATDGNYSCARSKCGVRGSFWGLIESVGKEPREYLGERPRPIFRPRKHRNYIYGK